MRERYERGRDGLYRKCVEFPDPHDRQRTLAHVCLVRDSTWRLVRVVKSRKAIKEELTLHERETTPAI